MRAGSEKEERVSLASLPRTLRSALQDGDLFAHLWQLAVFLRCGKQGVDSEFRRRAEVVRPRAGRVNWQQLLSSKRFESQLRSFPCNPASIVAQAMRTLPTLCAIACACRISKRTSLNIMPKLRPPGHELDRQHATANVPHADALKPSTGSWQNALQQ